MHTLDAFFNTDSSFHLILVLPEGQMAYWEELCKKYEFTVPCQIAKGGNTRYQSVKNGLELVPNDSLVAVHDGVRPFPKSGMILNLFQEAEERGNAIPSIPLNDSIRKIVAEANIALDRTLYRLIQTPQCFESNILKKAYSQAFKDTFTDESTVVEALGIKINLIEGDPGNIKITNPEDFICASARIAAEN